MFSESFEKKWQSFIERHYGGSEMLCQACSYALKGPGKRVRPILALETINLFAQTPSWFWEACFSLEMVHTYSLVHDDLPAMDDDDLRRGRATVHKAFDEATAILVGDTLLTDAFHVLSRAAIPTETKLKLIEELSEACGSKGMVLGQSLDMQWTGSKDGSMDDLNKIHLNKTGKLIRSSVLFGALCGGASSEQLRILSDWSQSLGFAYQMVDDLIDVNGQTGKSLGKDIKQGKLSFLKFFTIEELKERLEERIEHCQKKLTQLDLETSSLNELTSKLLKRTS